MFAQVYIPTEKIIEIQVNVSVSQEADERRTFAVNYMKEIAHTAILTERKKKKLNEILPEVFCKMVHSAVTDLNDLDTFMKNSFERIKNK